MHDFIRYFDLKGLGPLTHRPNVRDRIYLRRDYRGTERATAIISVSDTTYATVRERLASRSQSEH